ncbi:MAG: DUF721 domain-containing protein [Betaproteobacteria bacterium]|nr:DUF721 domain-containing protein [Betaproteobacteria bacterium]
MAAQKIGFWLTAPGDLQELAAKAHRLSDLQQAFVDSAPPQLARAGRVKNFRAGTLFLLADNSTAAAKLRQLVPRLLVNIQKTEPEVTGIHIGVQVKSSTNRPPSTAKKAALSPETIEEFIQLAARVPDPNLRSALAKLVRRHTKRT